MYTLATFNKNKKENRSTVYSFTWSIASVTPAFLLRLAAPLSDEQKFEVEVEQRLLNEWTDIKRKTYRANQELVREAEIDRFCVFIQLFHCQCEWYDGVLRGGSNFWVCEILRPFK